MFIFRGRAYKRVLHFPKWRQIWWVITETHGSTLFHHITTPMFCTEGECSGSASEGVKRSGAGKHASAGGVIYTGEWLEDKVCVQYSWCLLLNAGWLHLLVTHACSLSSRCTAEGPCSIPLEPSMKENSKTTCTTARERTPSRTAPLTKVTFTTTGDSQCVGFPMQSVV